MMQIGIIIIIIIIAIQIYCEYEKKSLTEVLHPDWYKDVTVFPKKNFVCKKNCEEYNKTVKNGYNKMKSSKIVFCGLCINIENKVDTLKKRFDHLGKYFDDFRVVIFENDSTDNTRNLLKKLTHLDNRYILIDCPNVTDCKYNTIQAKDHGVFSTERMKKMVFFRNKLLNYVKLNFYSFDVVCMVDLDIRGPIDVDGIAHSFGTYEKWDCISAFGLNGITFTLGKPVYYDIIAYKDNKFDINDNVIDVLPIQIKMLNAKKGNEIIKVKSGFAGLELIKMYVINDNITYTPHDGKYVCEHIIFHNNMIRKNYNNIYINPNMIVLVGIQGNEKKLYVY